MRPSLAAARLRNALAESEQYTRTPTCTRCSQPYIPKRDPNGLPLPVLKTEAVCPSCTSSPAPSLEPQS